MSLKQTPLFELHCELAAKLVTFAGYEMPINYPTGILREHAVVRARAGLFDVSHMGQLTVTGTTAANVAIALERLVPADLVNLQQGQLCYTVFTNDQGGIRDDLMITKRGDGFELVVNAANKHADLDYLRTNLDAGCVVESRFGRALLALQGPAAAQVLQRHAAGVTELEFLRSHEVDVAGIQACVSRAGYTGEDGFEISVAGDQATSLARRLLEEPEVEPIGLGARDTLRLEAGLCLHGQDLTPETSLIEANLNWTIARARRSDGQRAGGFPGAARLFEQLAQGPQRLRVGLSVLGKAPIRAKTVILDAHGVEVGQVTSGSFGPTVGGPIAMAYVMAAAAAPATRLHAVVRGKSIPVDVVSLPFVPHRYVRG